MTHAVLHSPELERAYLGGVLLDASILAAHPLAPEDMFIATHQVILIAMRAVFERDRDVDPSTLRDELVRNHGGVARAGGDEYILDLTEKIPTVALIPKHRNRIRELSALRATREKLLRAVAACEAQRTDDLAQIISDVVVASSSREEDSITLDDAGVSAWESMAKGKGLVPCGIRFVDQIVGGSNAGDCTIVGADTGIGKSSVVLLCVENLEAGGFLPGIVSIEDGKQTWGARAIASHSGVSARDLRSGRLSREGFEAAAMGTESLSGPGRRIRLQVLRGGSDVDVSASMTRMVREHGVNALIVDYLQAIELRGRSNKRCEEVARIASRLKGTAERLGVPLTLVSQLSRPPKDKPFREPTRYDLKESGDIENMAEMIILLWKESAEASFVNAKLEKGKWGGDGARFAFVRDRQSGVLREYGAIS